MEELKKVPPTVTYSYICSRMVSGKMILHFTNKLYALLTVVVRRWFSQKNKPGISHVKCIQRIA